MHDKLNRGESRKINVASTVPYMVEKDEDDLTDHDTSMGTNTIQRTLKNIHFLAHLASYQLTGFFSC